MNMEEFIEACKYVKISNASEATLAPLLFILRDIVVPVISYKDFS